MLQPSGIRPRFSRHSNPVPHPEFQHTPVLWDVEKVEDPMKLGKSFGAESSVQTDPSAQVGRVPVLPAEVVLV